MEHLLERNGEILTLDILDIWPPVQKLLRWQRSFPSPADDPDPDLPPP